MKSFRVYGLACVLFLVSFAARATTIVLPTDEQLIAKAPVIVDGIVLATEVVEVGDSLWTETTVAVQRNLKGTTPATVTVREPGGRTDDRITKIFGTPEFAAGERVLLFLAPSPRGGYRTVDLFIGKFAEKKTVAGQRLWHRDDAGEDATLLDANLEPVEPGNVQRDAQNFETFIHERLAGRAGVKNYAVAEPLLSDGSGKWDVRANFELIAEPTVYRWTGFDSGTQAQWYSSGKQSGYSGNGVNELQTAMASWTSYTAARIYYAYAGSRSGPMGGLDNRNGVNEVLFGDPLNEITGTWDKTTGGVVGTGGFNGINSQSVQWTSPFAADSAHPQKTYSTWTIVEGNLTIQDGVSPANGISSNRLAEIVSHEFGHTLGFGHSSDSTALMYYSVTGLGPALRADDQLAARWLYPNGSGGGTDPGTQAPAKPTNLTATVSGTDVILGWTDNATNETAQSVWSAPPGSSTYTKVRDLAANVNATTFSGLTSGTHQFYVVATNANGSSASDTVSVNVTLPAPVARFAVTPQGGTTFLFTDQSTGTIDSRMWTFGDGTQSNAVSPLHTFPGAGQYLVTLRLTGAGKISESSQYVNVSGALAASFIYSPASPTIDSTIQFTDQSTGGPTSWQWSFGDGTSSTLQNPAKKYAAVGNYTVTLTVFRGTGESSMGSRVVTVLASSPVTPSIGAAFDASTTHAAIGANVAFTDRSTGNPTSWLWTFGDGSSSTAQNPVHAYAAAGTYTVTLQASNASSSGSISKAIVVSNDTAYRTLVSVAAQTAGANNTSWRTELNVFNAGSQGANVTLLFLPSGGGSVATRTVVLAPRQSLTYANALFDLFGLSSGAGAMAIEATSAGAVADLRVTSRTFTTGTRGTYGQAVPDVQPEALERTLYVTGIAATDDFRTNIGLVNRGSSAVEATLTLLAHSGSTVASKTVSLPANSFQQRPLGELFPEVADAAHSVLTMRLVAASADTVSAYASVVDNQTQDPIYVQAVPASQGGALTIPVVGRAPGANGTFWRSDVTLYNPNGNQIALSLRYNGTTRTLVLGGGDTEVLADILSQFGQTSGSGTLTVSWSASTGPVVTSRTYTTVETGGTYGQSIDPVAAFASRAWVPGLRNDGSYRTNVGFVNGGTETETVTVTLLSSFGTELGRTTLTLNAGQLMQTSAAALFPNANLAAGFTLAVEGDANAKVFAYGSMVDNGSGDPVFFAGR